MENTPSPILEPIILNPVQLDPEPQAKKTGGRFRTLKLMFAGWFVGNLVSGTIIGIILLYTVASTGIVRVPLLSSILFPKPQTLLANSSDLESVNKKASQINKLESGQSIPEMTLSENEINAYLIDAFSKTETTFTNPRLQLNGQQFVFSANLKTTGAPVKIEGVVETSRGIFKMDVTKTTFGKLVLPAQLTNGLINEALAKVGFSLDNTPIPARKISIQDSQVTLEGVSKTQ